MNKKLRMTLCVALMLMLSPLMQVAALGQDPPPPPPDLGKACKEAMEKLDKESKEMAEKLKPLMDLITKKAKEMGASGAGAASAWAAKMKRTWGALTAKSAAAWNKLGKFGKGVGVTTILTTALYIYNWWDTEVEYQAFLDYMEEPNMTEANAWDLADDWGDLQDHIAMATGQPPEAFVAWWFHREELKEEKRECIYERKGPKPRDVIGDRGTGDKTGKLGVPNDNHGNTNVTVTCWVYGPIGVYEDGTPIMGWYPIDC